MDEFRRAQLVRLLHTRGQLTPERERQIRELPSEPIPREPPAPVLDAFSRGFISFANHVWTLPEHEGFLLWLSGEQLGRNS